MELIKWANDNGYTIRVTEVERQELIALLREEAIEVDLDGLTYKLEVERMP